VDIFDRYRFGSNRIFSVNENEVSNVPKTPPVFGNKGQKWARVARRFEKSRNITVHCAMSASGLFVSRVNFSVCK
jgi:hypothetical protein